MFEYLDSVRSYCYRIHGSKKVSVDVTEGIF